MTMDYSALRLFLNIAETDQMVYLATPNDFGASGARPTHPQLLDWLARELVRGDWKLKRLHKLMMTSKVYLQSTDYDAERAALDRENHLLWRREPRRLEAEVIRDAMLAVSGRLNGSMFGQPVSVTADLIFLTISSVESVRQMVAFEFESDFDIFVVGS